MFYHKQKSKYVGKKVTTSAQKVFNTDE